ncbi:YpoC family protein [Rossellomorea oryzaecorticis]|uniref:YpoC family protein n=1 Tax=Rossellomorea oryzaecorticis TaxID=1396505 RepID=A0ABW8VPR9_9BACI
MTAVRMILPVKLSDHFFFEKNEVVLNPDRYLEEGNFFAQEILFYSGEERNDFPWDHEEHSVSEVLAAWNEVQGMLKERFKSRDATAQIAMKKGIALFYMILFWGNSHPVVLNGWKLQIKDLSLKPVNIEERLSFIKENPHLYHSYVQLASLFQEQHKQFEKDRAMRHLNKYKK